MLKIIVKKFDLLQLDIVVTTVNLDNLFKQLTSCDGSLLNYKLGLVHFF